ncbi:hypothetical protein ACQZ4Q_08230 [Agrobacterium vitis]
MKNLVVSFQDRKVMTFLDAQAARFNCSPRHVVLALTKAIAKSDLVDAVLDGETPQELCPNARLTRHNQPLGLRQKKVLDWFLTQPGREVRIGAKRLARQIGIGPDVAAQVMISLRKAGYLTVVEKGKPGGPATLYKVNGGDVA